MALCDTWMHWAAVLGEQRTRAQCPYAAFDPPSEGSSVGQFCGVSQGAYEL